MEQLDFTFQTPVARRRRLVDPTWSQAIREQWSRRFEAHFPDRPFQVWFNNNTSTMISVRERFGMLEMRLHQMFIEAGERELKALAGYLRGGSGRGQHLDRFIAANRNRIARSTSRGRRSQGLFFDLELIRDCVARAYLDGPSDVPVVWGFGRRKRRQRSIRLGSYSFEDRVIHIHPVLDQAFVPGYVVVGVVHHELLHHDLGAEHQNGKRMVHTKRFREREKAFVHHERAERWERENLRRLLKG